MPNLKNKLLFSILLIFVSLQIFSQEILIRGIYQGENLFVMNPFASSGVGFCVYEVTVNGEVSTDEINSSAFEVDLSVYKFKFGDAVTVIVKHKKGCKPKILNMEVLKPKSTYRVTSINYDKNTKLLNWTTVNEKGSIPFIVEQFKWKKWVKVGTVQGKGIKGTHKYSMKIEDHSGKNRLRVKQIDFSKKPRYSPEITFRSLLPIVKFSPSKPKTEIKFTASTNYEIYNFYGKLIKKGRGRIVNVSKLKKGDYFLNYDNDTGRFTKK